eukprot:1302918-Rhodomonas_salina.3
MDARRHEHDQMQAANAMADRSARMMERRVLERWEQECCVRVTRRREEDKREGKRKRRSLWLSVEGWAEQVRRRQDGRREIQKREGKRRVGVLSEMVGRWSEAVWRAAEKRKRSESVKGRAEVGMRRGAKLAVDAWREQTLQRQRYLLRVLRVNARQDSCRKQRVWSLWSSKRGELAEAREKTRAFDRLAGVVMRSATMIPVPSE